MKLHGVGIDIVNILRFKNILNKNKNIEKRIFNQKELKYCKRKRKTQINCLAKRFAAKEAFSKSLGTGFSKGLTFNEVLIENDKFGKPQINIIGQSKLVVNKIFKNKKYKFSISLSDDKPSAIAIVLATYEK